MALDTRLPLAVQAPEIPDPLSRLAQVMQFREHREARQQASQAMTLKQIAQVVDASGNTPEVFQREVARAVQRGLFTQADAQPYLDAAAANPQVIARLTAHLLGKETKVPEPFTLGPGQTRFAPTNEAVASVPPTPPVATPFTLGPGQTRFDPTGAPLGAVPAVPAKVTYGAPQTQLVNGKRTLVRAGSDNRMYDMRGQAIAAEALSPEPTKEPNPAPQIFTGPDGQQHAVQFMNGEAKEIPLPTGYRKPNATVENRVVSAQTVKQTGDDIIAQLSDPAFAQTVGPAMGRFSSIRDFVGNPPPEFSQLAGEIESFALANMGVHGMRSAQGAEMIKRVLDQRHTPASLISAVRGLSVFSEKFIANARGSTALTTQHPPSDRRTKAQSILQGAGKANDDAAVDLFLKNNPEFK